MRELNRRAAEGEGEGRHGARVDGGADDHAVDPATLPR